MYELLKQLKEVGYPQEGIGDTKFDPTHPLFVQRYYDPTTDELIEELGDDFGSLFAGGDLGFVADKGLHEGPQKGSTPKEALINLYIELHKK